uniref:NADH dehydrogenase [ubiquinone] 1 subunit C2 n=1 Tax=Ailuropoda melanoleuca TaxID=9646 RepID=A0A7N5P664_AILME
PAGLPGAMQLRFLIPDESLSLPPPPLFNFCSFWMAATFWVGALFDNGIRQRPILRTGVHRQLLLASLGFSLGYYLRRHANYRFAQRDRELFSYIQQHPEDFKEEETKKFSEVLEKFVPIR